MARFVFEAPEDLARYIAEKGSVSPRRHLAHRQRRDGARFDVMIIPHTLAVTTWGERGRATTSTSRSTSSRATWSGCGSPPERAGQRAGRDHVPPPAEPWTRHGRHFLIIEARFYADLADELVKGAAAELEQRGATLRADLRAGRAGDPGGAGDGAERRRPPAATTATCCSAASSAARPRITTSSPTNRRAPHPATRGGAGARGRQRHPDGRERRAGLGARARRREEQGRGRAAAAFEMAALREKLRLAWLSAADSRQSRQPARRGAARRRAGALPDGCRRRDAAGRGRGVRGAPARAGAGRRAAAAGRCRFLPLAGRRRRRAAAADRSDHPCGAAADLAADPHRPDAPRHPALRRLRAPGAARRAGARRHQRICRRGARLLRGRRAGAGERRARPRGARCAAGGLFAARASG